MKNTWLKQLEVDMPSHNPNPFDFVPFAERPYLRTPEDLDMLGEHLNGYLEVRLKALTPVHIVGYQTSSGSAGKNHFYMQNGRYCIPASSIRGCLRAFIEALTSGWVSQANLVYKKEYKKRHIGFSTFEKYPNQGRTMKRLSPEAVNVDYKPEKRPDGEMDIASYLFGIVTEPKEGQTKDDALNRKSKIIIEDAYFTNDSLDDISWIPDIKDLNENNDAFMGGPKPTASNWWYLKPEQVLPRHVQGMSAVLAEFIGNLFRGRKFYFHQEPGKCLEYYQKKWHFAADRPLYKVFIESLSSGAETGTFRIYLEDMPEPLARLFTLALIPGNKIKHKLGYGKAFGYGSVEFQVVAARFRRSVKPGRVPAPLMDFSAEVNAWLDSAWDRSKLTEEKLEDIIDWNALNKLAVILGWLDHERLLFTYPPFERGGFLPPIHYDDFSTLHESSARGIAEKIFDTKRAIHFQVYQERSNDWKEIIGRRKP
jgi:CRISPR/Cas system CSM-associated protein Csm3 (group 7 of RAMP superfamily)